MADEEGRPPPETLPRWGLLATGVVLGLWLLINVFADPLGDLIAAEVNRIELSWIPR